MICQCCNSYFPSSIIIEGKRRILNKRKHCLNCSPFGKHLTQPLEKGPFACVRIRNSNLSIVKCQECGKIYDRTKRKGHSKTRCNSCVVNHRRQKIKQRLVDYKGGKCAKCSYVGCLDVYDFHHVDPKEKDFAINLSCASMKFENLLKEVEKCELLCCRCHREEHARLNALNKQKRLSACS